MFSRLKHVSLRSFHGSGIITYREALAAVFLEGYVSNFLRHITF